VTKLLWLLIGVFSFILRPGRTGCNASRYPSEEEHRTAEQAHWRQQRKIEFTAVILSALAAAAAISGLFQAIGAANVAQDQLHVMRDEQRPWIKVEPENVGDFVVSNGLGTPQAVLLVDFRITNVGRTPAFNVRFLVDGFVSPPAPDGQDVLREQQRRCESLRHGQLDTRGRKSIIFPKDYIADTDLGPAGARAVTTGTMPGEIARALREGDGKTFWFYLYGCADYALTGGAEGHHQTGFVFQVLRVVPRDEQTDVVTPAFTLSDVAPKNIRLRQLPSASGQTD